jgi:hypothetical protein
MNSYQIADVVFEHTVGSSRGCLPNGLADEPFKAENSTKSADQRRRPVTASTCLFADLVTVVQIAVQVERELRHESLRFAP